MKRIFAFLLIFLVLLPAAAETVPNGMTYGAFYATYDESLLAGWQTTTYIDAAGFLFTAFTEDAEITVSVDESGNAQTASAYLRRLLNNVSRYGRVTGYSGPFSWENPWDVDGASIRYHYMYLNGAHTDDEYETSVYVAPFSANYFLVISVNAWGMNAAENIRMFETEFLPSLKVGTRRVSTPFLAYLRGAGRDEDGCLTATLDFCAVEYAPSIFTVYIANSDPTEHVYEFAADALLYLPGALQPVRPGEEALFSALESGEEAGIYQFLFDENDEIVWMMHYNAF